MLGNYFYHATIRKIIAVFGTLFNDIKIGRKDDDGNMTNVRVVPLAYGPRQKFITRIEERPVLPAENVAIKLPRMSFMMSGITYDFARQGPKLNTHKIISESSGTSVATQIFNSVPYKLNFELSIMTKNQDEGLQIIEQILPFFAPSFGLRIKPINNTQIVDDIQITLSTISIDDKYDGEYTARRVLVYTLNFEVIANIYGNILDREVIKTAIVNFKDKENLNLIEKITASVNPLSADKNGIYTIDVDIENFIDDL